ncbi:26 kDa periplasmic immunogenic protein precursor [Slackia heliotrinireducens]|uniref:Uncharacterized conserved protein n=1 Tax=Slackia heliotrinireducens (strain ATCC 29202 / DSM 20476 / NCTC 11029 / RHS 1) TaxID=471855 RepID=C7N0S3_SLAHD|nr:SIMPL domain-containing protein [Slackia heliotrinireducens]ACV21151.1 uncharacterized conserved protein [Slackia heliotrinireducens DSM 20476]VEH03852.1 26 kDa periplasmic immunogenic protein precursor [Slackia heliotrinireducens]
MGAKVLKALVFGATAALAMALAACTQAPAAGPTSVVVSETGSAITVTAQSEVKAVPDKASIGLSIVVQADTSEEAQAQAAEASNAVTAQLKAAGIDEKDIQTDWTNLSPIYNYNYDAKTGEDVETIIGYESDTHIVVSGLEVDAVGDVMQMAVEAGATGVDGPSYYCSDYDAAYQEALAAAMEASREKAQVVADAGNVGLGQVINVVEGQQDMGMKYASTGVYAEEAAADMEGSMDVQAGEVTVTAQVTVSYAIA